MKKLIALLVAAMFGLGSVAVYAADTGAAGGDAPKAEKKAAKKSSKKASKKAAKKADAAAAPATK